MNPARQRDILFLAIAGAQVCWIYTTVLLLDVKAVEGDLPLLGIMSFYPLAFVLGRALRRLPWGEIRLFVLSWVLWFLFFLGVAKHYAAPFGNPFEPAWIHSFSGGLFQVSYLSTQQLTLACSVLLWWLGSRLLRLRLDFATSLTEFQFGVAILLILFFFESQWDLDLPGLVPLTMAFFVFSFAGTAITHAREGAGWLSGPFRSRWMSLLIFTLVVVLMGGMIIVALVKPDILKLILSLLSMGWTFFWDLIFRVLSFLASLFSSDQPAPLPAMPAMPAPPPESPSWVKLFRLPEWVRRVGSVVMVCIWMILILAAIWSVSSQIIRWLRQRLEGMSEVEVEPMSGAFLDDLLYLFKWLFLLTGRFFRFVLRPFRRKRKMPEVSAEISSIRTIYRRMLDWAATLGCPRDVTLTPLEYLKVLSDRIPEAGHEVSIITHQYVLVRYGDYQPTRDTLGRVKATWERLRAVKPAVPGKS